jgi:hypothetical protein
MKFQGKLPSDKLNGLLAIADALVKDPKGTHVIVAVVDAGKVEKETDTGLMTPHARFRQVEVISGPGDIETARRLLVRAQDDRLGRVAIPGIDEGVMSDLERIERLVQSEGLNDDDDDQEHDPEN